MYDMLDFKSFAQTITDRTFTDYYYRLMLLARSAFEWVNLPKGMDEKWIERYLYNDGYCVFYKHPTMGYMVSPAALNGNVNPYDEPTHIHAVPTGIDGLTLENNVNCVLMRNNDSMIPTIRTIEMFAYRLAEISRTIDVNINAQKTPVIILCDNNEKMSMKRLYKQWNGFEPLIMGSKDLDMSNIKTLDTKAPIVFDKLQIHKHDIWNECMTFLGINNANMDKRERLVDDEVQANNEQVELSGLVMLKARQQAAKQINDMFGLNIEVKFRERERSGDIDDVRSDNSSIKNLA